MESKKRTTTKTKASQSKRPFTKNDFEAVLKVVTKPLKQEQGGTASAKT